MLPIRLLAVATTFLLGLACQAPFGTDRHDLVGDRLVAITAEPQGDDVVLRTWHLVDGRAWTDEAVETDWHWLSPGVSIDDITDEPAAAAGSSWAITPAPDARRVGLISQFPSGAVWRAELDLPASGPEPLPLPNDLTLAVLEEFTLDSPTEDELATEARASLSPEPATHVPEAGWARLTATFADGIPERLTMVRWMTLGGRGTFLELDETQTDWVAADVLFDDLEIEEATAIEPGPVSVVALVLDGQAGNRVSVREHWIGPPAGGFFSAGRWYTSDLDGAAQGLIRGRLTADDTSPTGLTLTEAALIEPAALDAEDPYGTASIPCADSDGPLDPNWMFDGRCLRSELIDQVVTLEVDP